MMFDRRDVNVSFEFLPKSVYLYILFFSPGMLGIVPMFRNQSNRKTILIKFNFFTDKSSVGYFIVIV